MLTIDPDARVVVLGDLNDDWFSGTITALAPLTNLWEQIPARERYSYIFDGNAQTFDHVLVSPALATAARFDVVHVAAEFPNGVSDHDPVMAAVRIAPAALAAAPELAVSLPHPNPFNGIVKMEVTGTNIRAAIFDVAGRKVTAAAVVNGVISWGGHDDAGRNAPAGVYFVRLSDGISTRAQKVVIVRR
jgi:hypothetical protein